MSNNQDNGNAAIKELTSIMQDLKAVERHAMYYIPQGVDYFTVSLGPWTLTFDCTK